MTEPVLKSNTGCNPLYNIAEKVGLCKSFFGGGDNERLDCRCCFSTRNVFSEPSLNGFPSPTPPPISLSSIYICTSAEISLSPYWCWWSGLAPFLDTVFQGVLKKHRNKRNCFEIKILIQHRKCYLNLYNP